MRKIAIASSAFLALSAILTGCSAPAGGASLADGNESADQPEIVIRSEAPPIEIYSEAPTPIATPAESAGPSSATASTAQDAENLGEEATGALELLAEVPVKGRAPKTGYDRDLFGSGWGDPDRNGCDARNDILARDLVVHSFQDGTGDCVVLTGTLNDPYTGKSIQFQRGQGTSNAVQIDHVVALSDAWQKGAQQLSAVERQEFANDPLNLLAVDGPTNASKGDSDAATWLPPERGYWCDYVTRQVEVKHKYGLWMTGAEHAASERILSENCT